MRPLQLWLKSRVPWTAWTSGRLSIEVTCGCIEALAPWRNTDLFSRGVPLGLVTSRVVVTTDTSTLGWGAVCEGMPASGRWSEPQIRWHINRLELEAVFLALKEFRAQLERQHVLIRTDNTSVVSYINRQGGIRSKALCEQAAILLLWADSRLLSIRATHIPGLLNRGADMLSRRRIPQGEWRLHPESVQVIWNLYGKAEVDLFSTSENAHCPLFFSLSHSPLEGDALTAHWPAARLYVSSDQNIASGVMQDQGGASVSDTHSPELAEPALVSRPDRAVDSPSLADSGQEGHAIPGGRLGVAPEPGTMEPSCVAASGLSEELNALQSRVIDTLTEARAPSTRRLYALKWGVFVKWCHQAHIDPVTCTVLDVLSFLQYRLDSGSLPSTLKVYVAAIAAFRSPQGGQSIGRNAMVVNFLKGARRLHPPRPPSVPPWDLEVVLRALSQPPFEPLTSVGLKELSLKTTLLLALASAKRIGDLHAFSVDSDCIRFGPGDCSVTLRPRMGYVPKSLSTPFKTQTVSLSALSSESTASLEADAQTSVCPVRALRIYINRSASFRQSDQLFVCYGGCARGRAVSKQRLSHWIVDAITAAYTSQGLECPLHISGHSTRAIASSWAWSRGMSIRDICVAAGWSSQNTFARFYKLDVQSFASQVLSVSG